MSTTLIKSYQKALEAGVPIIGVHTPDPGMTIRSLCLARPASRAQEEHAILQWDVITGLSLTPSEQVMIEENTAPKHLKSTAVLKDLIPDQASASALKNLAVALQKFRMLPDNTMVFLHNAHRFLHDTAIIQAIWLLRDQFKAAGQTLILLASNLKLPQELVHDVLVLDDPLPAREDLKTILSLQYENTIKEVPSIPSPTEDLLDKAIDAVTGLSAFAAEQAIAMAFTTQGLSVPKLWERKYDAIEQTPGLKIYRGQERFNDIGGIPQIKTFLSQILTGRNHPRAIVFMDEIEKLIAGANAAHGDNTGVSQDLHRQLLEYMQNTDATGIICCGAPGTSKSLISKAAGTEAGIPTIELDLGAIKTGQVGASEYNMRQALKIISTISNNSALFLATCNSLDTLSPELRRRFRLGTFIFPLPNTEERAAIWTIYLKKYGLTESADRLLHEPWTGAEIRQCADIAWRLNIPLEEAASYILPVSISAKQSIETLYAKADGAFLCASYPGPFRKDHNPQPSTNKRVRKMHLGTQPLVAQD